MKREDIRLRRAARHGDVQAMLTLAKRYLSGSGMPRNVPTGLGYLQSQRTTPDAAALVCRNLALEELIQHQQLDLLCIYGGEEPQFQINLAVWKMLGGNAEEGLKAICEHLPDGLNLKSSWGPLSLQQRITAVLQHLSSAEMIHGQAVALAAAKHFHDSGDLSRFSFLLQTAVELRVADSLTREWIYRAITLSLAESRPILHLDPQHVHAALEFAAARAEPQAWLVLGLALCGLPCGVNPASSLVTRENLRRGTAFLVRAADAGFSEAWLHLHRLNSNPRCSVANPEMARFCLEKAASAGHPEAQRRLGALLLSRSRTVVETEQAVSWLHLAAAQQDSHARTLLRSLVLPVEGDDEEADQILSRVQKTDLWLCARLRLAREFGLTKQEALCVDPIAGERPWGLVTTAIPYVSHSKLSAPRAVPAVTPAAVAALRHAVSLFAPAAYQEVDFAQRANSQRRRIAQLGLDETLFFANADSSERDRVRIGTRWAHHARTLLHGALSPSVHPIQAI